MSEKTYTLPRSGQAPLRFTGALVAQSDNEGNDNNRWYRVTVYESQGRYVVHVGYHTRWESETDHDYVGVASDPGEVGKLLSSYDVLPEGRGYPPTQAFEERQRRLRAALQRDFDSIVSEVLDAEVFTETLGDEEESFASPLDWQFVQGFAATLLQDIPLTRKEACALCEANSCSMAMEGQWTATVPNLVDSPGLDAKWEVSTQDLASRLAKLDRPHVFALTVATITFWRNAGLPTPVALAKAGFHLID
jgi:hypothetical protein